MTSPSDHNDIVTPTSSVTQLHQIIDSVYRKYEHNEPVLAKLTSSIIQLPTLMAAYESTLQERTERKKALINTSDEFIDQFLSTSGHNYFYNSAIDLFFTYDNTKYDKIDEDDIVHSALVALQDYPELKPWKYKIKNQLVKRIKERELLNSIPESCTIQKVIGMFYPSIFTGRDAVKHFLTVLGDIMNKKNVNFYFISAKAKQFIKELSIECCTLFGTSSLNNVFKFKFYDHTYSECRLLDINENGLSSINVSDYSSPFKRNIVDIMCVASHYSKRFGNADAFLESPYCKDAALAAHCFYLKTNDDAAIVNRFIATTTEPCNSQHVISWRKMQYLWKLFLEEERLPYVIFTNQLKTRLMTLLPHTIVPGGSSASAPTSDEDLHATDTLLFTSLTSKHLPIVSEFLSFWTETIETTKEDDELELDELTVLFMSYIKSKKMFHKTASNIKITDQFMCGLVKHFFSDVHIEDDKYLINISSKLWNKKQEISQALAIIGDGTLSFPNTHVSKSNGGALSARGGGGVGDGGGSDSEHWGDSDSDNVSKLQPPVSPHMTIYNAYERYCSYSYSRKSHVASKRYFEKYYDMLCKPDTPVYPI
jgi:hypothetical protein